MNDDLPPVETDPEIDGAGPAPSMGQKPQKRPSATGTFAPVGDIQVKKKAKTYNTYTLQLSMGQIEAIHTALEKDHANPIADELLKLFGYYLQNVPGPGEEEEDIKAQDEHDAVNGDIGDEGDEVEDDLPLPMPPGYKGDGRTTVAGEGPEDLPGDDELPGGGDLPPGRNIADDESPALPGDETPEEDRRLPAPPRE
jgi:hypothetical protein